MNKLTEKAIVELLAVFTVVPVFADKAQSELEYYLQHGNWYVDNITDESSFPPYVPRRYRNSLPQFEGFIASHGWTTNQFIQGLICAITNNVTDEKWADEGKKRIARVAAWKLGEIDNPAVTNFFRQFNDSNDTPRLKATSITSMFRRTNLEPEVMTYMRSLCVRTNIYCKAEALVMRDMFETLDTMQEELKQAATNRVAKYMYFAIWHTVRNVSWQDKELAKFIPAYSNSVQRLSSIKHVEATTQNPRLREWAKKEADALSAIPTNQLNNISWIAEDVTNGK